ncbi:gluconate:H+ symporter [Roseisolibacter sp. H3M3-2]|uniref:gluconate:H+ symporter n=1 Tax=Roseisolibacter sp. H3M3-2 TaxID=3031323 RepID=UPI0023DA2CA6|nr:gluconate:H+ symporter [Roseisolibacter sp. H3M3-2]MDF1505236.1 gluconate:H+ symporter [Roseisolibacter sp. H3M3-2]
MPLLWVAVAVALMLALLLAAKLDAFFALLLTALAVGLLNGMDVLEALRSVLRGVGNTLGSVALVLVFGAMLGRLVDESGAAHAITTRLVDAFGRARVPYAMALTGLLVGLPMLYNAGFLLLIPLVYAVAAATGLPLVRVGVPLAAALSVTHGFLPPHPAPTFVAFAYGADVNRTLLVGLVATIPAILIGGIGFSRLLPARGATEPPPGLFTPRATARADLPGLGVGLLVVLLPVLLMLVGSVVDVAMGTAALDPMRADVDFAARLAETVPDAAGRRVVVAAKFLGNATVALMLAVLLGVWLLGLRRGRTMDDVMKSLGASAAAIATILLVIAAGGAFSQVLRDGGVAEWIAARATGLALDPLVLAFGVAALLRLAVGSATVAGMTTAGVMAPMAAASGVRPELMVLATGAGSLMFSHFNDTGFWMFKEYFGLTVRETLATWSVMEMLVALAGLGAALAIRALA